jgi:hypothetical protein
MGVILFFLLEICFFKVYVFGLNYKAQVKEVKFESY